MLGVRATVLQSEMKPERNSLPHDHCLSERFENRWFEWIRVIQPQYCGFAFDKRRHQIGYTLDTKRLKKVLQKNGVYGPGIYEIAMIVDVDEFHVVYVGKTNDLARRIRSYISNGSHNAEKIDEVLAYRCAIGVRVLQTRKPDAAERYLLGKFSYEWNEVYPKEKPSSSNSYEGEGTLGLSMEGASGFLWDDSESDDSDEETCALYAKYASDTRAEQEEYEDGRCHLWRISHQNGLQQNGFRNLQNLEQMDPLACSFPGYRTRWVGHGMSPFPYAGNFRFGGHRMSSFSDALGDFRFGGHRMSSFPWL